MLILKRRAHLRHLRKQPRGTALLAPDSSSNAESSSSFAHNGDRSGRMTESPLSPGAIYPGADTFAAANFAAIPAPQPYQLSNSTPAAGSTFHSASANPVIASGLLVDIDAAHLSAIPSLPSPHEQGVPEPIHSNLAGTSAMSDLQSRSPPLSTMHGDLVAFQKDLERDEEKRNQPSGSGRVEASDPPPVYSD
ncbi:hypothetical protein DXG01_016712 [Tephrocybe rancida]|nr:hypothetical protein DXG01_016712 [Tephrocybe rancida]